ncbi:MAG: hypothetical protein FRX48_04348 [Lasallia pustulata]|uniref:Guanine nucleotide-exchange factor SEC12 n=1 Tax=Lasallia pustulata TaxID=136370 RepID=A0A5M8PU49_9LECA|nr:MAG: hypothetical protein FRX48_04348 [Lasallia pustulata]
MAPPIASAKATLSYPLYAADFDPHNSGFLLVGGGGGEGRSGVGNKITLLNTSRKAEISEVVDIDLSRDEDSVTTLAVARSSETSATALAGINSSSAEQQAGRNEHLRAFRISYPPKRRTAADGQENNNGEVLSYTGDTKALGKASLFAPSSAAKKETYQRVLRLSRARKDSPLRIGAVATGLAPEGEIVVFDASSSRPSEDDVRGRIRLGRKEEAGDIDITEGRDGEYLIAYCTDYEVYLYGLQSTTKESTTEPRFIYGTPHPDAFAKSKARPTFRSLRFLTPNLILLLQNLPGRTGAELLLLDIPRATSLGEIILRKLLHKAIKSASGLSTALLAPFDLTTQDKKQHVIAIAGADISLSILTIDLPSGRPRFTTHAFLPAVHPLQITGLTLSTFHPPPNVSTAPPQYLKLASISMGSTVVVHTLPLSPYPPPTSKSASKYPPRYVLTVPGRPSESAQLGFSVLVSIIVVALGAFFLQAWTEIRGGTPEYLGAKGWLSERVHGWVARPYMFESVDTPIITTKLPEVENVRERAMQMNAEVTDRAQMVRQAVEEAVRKGMPGVEDVRSVLPQMPSVEELKQKVPSVADVKRYVPAAEDIQNAMPAMPSVADAKDKMPGLADVKRAMQDLPSASDLPTKLPPTDQLKHNLPNIHHVIDSLPNLPSASALPPTSPHRLPQTPFRHLLSLPRNPPSSSTTPTPPPPPSPSAPTPTPTTRPPTQSAGKSCRRARRRGGGGGWCRRRSGRSRRGRRC